MTDDTSKDYDDMVGFISEDNLPKTLSEFLGDEEIYNPSVKPKNVDPEYPEDWQTLYVNFRTPEDYYEFMNSIGEKPVPKLKSLVYTAEKDDGILSFLGD